MSFLNLHISYYVALCIHCTCLLYTSILCPVVSSSDGLSLLLTAGTRFPDFHHYYGIVQHSPWVDAQVNAFSLPHCFWIFVVLRFYFLAELPFSGMICYDSFYYLNFTVFLGIDYYYNYYWPLHNLLFVECLLVVHSYDPLYFLISIYFFSNKFLAHNSPIGLPYLQ